MLRGLVCVAIHPRCCGCGHQILNLEHHLDVLEKKPGAFAGSAPVKQWREAGRWPDCLDELWRELEVQRGRCGVAPFAARMPESEERRRCGAPLAEELLQFERPLPVTDACNLLLVGRTGGLQ